MLILLLQTSLDEKVKNAPDTGYEIGLVIGAYLPFVILVGIAYWIYFYNKNKGG